MSNEIVYYFFLFLFHMCVHIYISCLLRYGYIRVCMRHRYIYPHISHI